MIPSNYDVLKDKLVQFLTKEAGALGSKKLIGKDKEGLDKQAIIKTIKNKVQDIGNAFRGRVSDRTSSQYGKLISELKPHKGDLLSDKKSRQKLVYLPEDIDKFKEVVKKKKVISKQLREDLKDQYGKSVNWRANKWDDAVTSHGNLRYYTERDKYRRKRLKKRIGESLKNYKDSQSRRNEDTRDKVFLGLSGASMLGGAAAGGTLIHSKLKKKRR